MLLDIDRRELVVGDTIAFATASRTRPYLYVLEILEIGTQLTSGYIPVKVKHLRPNHIYRPVYGDVSTIDGNLFFRKALKI